MSIVYEANDLTLQRRVAIKLLQARSGDDSNLGRFLREANAIAAIQHPNVVTIHEFNTEPDSLTPYLIMEFVDGPSLLDRIQSGKPIPFRTTVHWIA
jgi:serine/threonine-protein kinase